jgi:2-polyprenyl-3-methyl-5-hydroxy-6-metoxy-1,4-benzoquinol methylase
MMRMPTADRPEGKMCEESIGTVVNPSCLLCGSLGKAIYEELQDRIGDAPGQWTLKRCSSKPCGILWLDPMPTPDDIWKAYRTYYTHSDYPVGQLKQDWARRVFRSVMSQLKASYIGLKYGYLSEERRLVARQLGWMAYAMPWRRSQWDMSVMFLPSVQGGSLLEVGSGSGDLLVELRELGWNVEGIDVDPMAVENSMGRGLKVRQGTLEALGYPDNTFDAIVMSHVIEHVHDPVSLLSECFRILKLGGQLSLVTPNAQSFCHRVFGRAWLALDPPRHLHIFTLNAMQAVMHRSGFHHARVFNTVRDADGTFVASSSIQRTGRFKMRSSHPYPVKMLGRVVQVVEWLLSTLDTSAGEELSVVAHKTTITGELTDVQIN